MIGAELIPRRVLFGDASTAAPRMSSDGRQLAWARQIGDITNIVACRTLDVDSSRQLTFKTRASLTSFLVWARDSRHLIVFSDELGNENYTAHSLDTESGQLSELSIDKSARTLFLGDSARRPDTVALCMNVRDRSLFDLYEANVVTAECRLVFENPGFSKLHIDDDLALRVAERVSADGSIDVLHLRTGVDWTLLFTIPVEDALTTRIDAVRDHGQSLYLIDSRARNTAALYRYDVASRNRSLLAEDAYSDVHRIIYHPVTGKAIACVSTGGRSQMHWIDEGFRARFEASFSCIGDDTEVDLIDVDDAQRLALLRVVSSKTLPTYMLQETTRPARRLTQFCAPEPFQAPRKMEVVTIASRDGWPMVSYLTRAAPERSEGRLVLVVHGGPYDRDRWGYDPLHHWLSDRGYSVLSVNFRGSTGFGKAFTEAARREWGGRMQDDLCDAVSWAIAQGFADPARVGIYGSSYGGYAALMAMARDPDVFACAVDICGPSSLLSFVQGIPTSWRSWFPTILRHLASPDTVEGRDWLLQRSPLYLASAIQGPVLIAQGLHDARVAASESAQIFETLSAHQIEASHLTFADEGHFFTRASNRQFLAGVVECFLAQHLGGQFEPMEDGSDAISASLHGSMALRGEIGLRQRAQRISAGEGGTK